MLLFLGVLFFLFVLECIFTEVENFGLATVVLLVTLALTIAAHHVWANVPSVVDVVKSNGAFSLVYIVIYVAVGIAWSFVKWFSYLLRFRDAFREQKEIFLKKENEKRAKNLIGHTGGDAPSSLERFKRLSEGPLDLNAPVPQDLMGAFEKHLSYGVKFGDSWLSMERPRAAKNKYRITAWASFWPFSVVGTLLNDPVRRFFHFLFDQFKALYERVSNFVFRKDVELK
jgi:hypothetical protein